MTLPGPCIVDDDGFPRDEYPEDVAHIARWDPKRVLAECHAKRRIVEEHPMDDFLPHPTCRRCAEQYTDEDDDGEVEDLSSSLAFPCLTLRLLALPYASRDGYQAEWAP